MSLQEFMEISSWIAPMLLAITMHEAAHGFAAWKLGDNTAHWAGRVTLNPFRHIDFFGTILLPGLLLWMRAPFLFGYAKPVPVDFSRLGRPRRDMALVALAGPGANLLLAVASVALLHLSLFVGPDEAPWLYANLYRSLLINLVLCMFNLLPILPLDGGRVLAAMLPEILTRPFARLERYGILIVLGLLLLPELLGEQWNVIYYAVGVPAETLANLLLKLFGPSGAAIEPGGF